MPNHQPETIVITGASGGIGQALLNTLAEHYPHAQITATYHHSEPSAQPQANGTIQWQALDLTDAQAVDQFAQGFKRVDWLINCAGLLHQGDHGPEKSIRQFDSDFFQRNIQINTLPTLLLSHAFSNPLKNSPQAVFASLSARVGSISDNRLGGWYSYRISKAALNMAIKTLAIEWQRSHKNVCVAALHPGTTDTELSKPFQRNVPVDKLFTPQQSAGYLLQVIQSLNAENSGQLWAWDGQVIPW